MQCSLFDIVLILLAVSALFLTGIAPEIVGTVVLSLKWLDISFRPGHIPALHMSQIFVIMNAMTLLNNSIN